MKEQRKIVLPLILIFILVNALIFTSGGLLEKWGIHKEIFSISNSLLFILSMLTFLLQKKSLNNSNPNVFVRTMMVTLMIKMILCAVMILIYIKAGGPLYSKQTVVAAMLLYIIYLTVEVRVILKMNKLKNV